MSNCPNCGQTLGLIYEDGGLAESEFDYCSCEWQADDECFDVDSEEYNFDAIYSNE